MPGWEGSTRKARLPANWPQLRVETLQRDRYRCQHRERPGAEVCGAYANQVDHIVAGDDHSASNRQALCEPHHRTKSAREGGQSFIPLRRPGEPHPAL